MNIITILGSPRKKGNTSTLLSFLEEKLKKDNLVRRFNIPLKGINGCLGCDRCQEIADEPGCVHSDFLAEILDEICSADLVIYSSAIYAWDFTSQMKGLIDRHYSLVKWKSEPNRHLIKDKSVALLATCAGGPGGNGDLITEIFKRQTDYLKCRNLGSFIIGNCTEPENMKKEAFDTVEEMASAIIHNWENI